MQCGEDGVGREEWTDCVQSDIRALGIAGDWNATALKAEVWVETVTESGRRFMAAWRKEEVDAARGRKRQRDWENCYPTRKLGGGARAARLSLLFSFPCSGDHEQDRQFYPG